MKSFNYKEHVVFSCRDINIKAQDSTSNPDKIDGIIVVSSANGITNGGKTMTFSAWRLEGNASYTAEIQIRYEQINYHSCLNQSDRIRYNLVWKMFQNDSCLNRPLLTLREGAAPHSQRQLHYNQGWAPDLIKTISHLPLKTVKRAFPGSHYLLPFALHELMTSRPLCGLQIVPTSVLNVNLKHKTTTRTTKKRKQAGVNIKSGIIAAPQRPGSARRG